MPIRFKYRQGMQLASNQKYVGRPTPFGNPFPVTQYLKREHCIADHKDYVDENPELISKIKRELKGFDLGCWCSLKETCHADYLLKIANEE
jgi:hypothetical protein